MKSNKIMLLTWTTLVTVLWSTNCAAEWRGPDFLINGSSLIALDPAMKNWKHY